jgi:hypothetical protein
VTTTGITSDALHYLDHKTQGIGQMLLHEDLARVRMRDAERFAERQRLARRLAAADRWRRLSGWALKRAAASARDL